MTINIDNTYLGFTNDKKPMQAARIEKSLDLCWRLENGTFSRKQIVLDLLQEDRLPTIEKGYSYYSARLDDYTKPKTLYKLENMETGTYLEINKTLHDFAKYVIKNGFLDTEKVKQFIENEQAELKRIKEEEKQKKEELRQQQETENKQREAERAKKYEEYQEKNLELGRAFIKRLGHDPIEQLLDKHVPKYIELDEKENNRIVPDTEAELFYKNWYDKMTILIGDFNYCNHTVKRYAENQKKNNFREYDFRNIRLFLEQQLLTKVYKNIDLFNDHVNTINAKMNAIYYSKEYKGSKPIQEYEFYYVISHKKREYHKAVGQKFKVEGVTFYLRRLEDDTYTTTEESSGLAIIKNLTNKTEIIQKTRETIRHKKEQIQRVIDREIGASGGTPLFKEKQLISS